ncbi:ribonuclease H-like domain-containing protein [Tanacetum coccineum]
MRIPHTRLYKTTPNYADLRVFGCLCYPHVHTNHKLEPRATPSIFLGYPTNHRGYRCLDLNTDKIILSRHVTFDETVFPYGSMTPESLPPYNFLDTDPNLIQKHMLHDMPTVGSSPIAVTRQPTSPSPQPTSTSAHSTGPPTNQPTNHSTLHPTPSAPTNPTPTTNLPPTNNSSELLERASMLTCNPCRTPVDTDSKLSADGDPVSDPTLYRSLARALQYLTFTLPDISYAVQQVTLSRSSAEVEYRGVANAVAETCWLRNLLRELHTPLSTATLVYCDNVSAVYLSSNPVQHQRTKHIEIDIHFVRDLVAAGHIRVLHVPSRYQYADVFTKGLPTFFLFDEFASARVFVPSLAQTAGGC